MSEPNDLSEPELDAVTGGLHLQLGGLGIDIGEKSLGILFGMTVKGVGGFAITSNGACAALKGVGGVCT